jgi:hypothetical protein
MAQNTLPRYFMKSHDLKKKVIEQEMFCFSIQTFSGTFLIPRRNEKT